MAKQKRKRRANGLPWYRTERDCWCIPGDPKKAPIRDEQGVIVRGKENQQLALTAWHAMMSLSGADSLGMDNEIKNVLELYLRAAEKRVSKNTFANYQKWFQSFVDMWKGLLVRELKTSHIVKWWDKAYPKWGDSAKNLSGSAFKAVFKWAASPGQGDIIPKNPLSGMTLPQMKKRSDAVVVTQEEFERLLSYVKSEPVRDILIVLWETGTRPVNLSRATAKNVVQDGHALLFAESNTDPTLGIHKTFKTSGRPLRVPLPKAAREVVAKLVERYPDGPLFRTAQGQVWTKTGLASIVRYYSNRAGLGGRFMAYSCRHSLATRLLEEGASDVDVAAILGNSPAVVHRNYSHVAAKTRRLLKVMEGENAVIGGSAGPANEQPWTSQQAS